MFESPSSLHNCCVDYVCENLSAVCDVQQVDEDQEKYVFKDSENFALPSVIAEQLLYALCEKGLLNDKTIALFNSKNSSLQHVHIFNSTDVSINGLRMLRSHKITKLEAIGLENVCVNDLIGCLGEWTLANLRHLNVSETSFLNSQKFHVFVALDKLRSLEHLNVSNTEFNQQGLESITENLLNLKSLDISSTPITDIKAVLKCQKTLTSLSMYNLKNVENNEVIPILLQLNKLQHLDISNDNPEPSNGALRTHRISKLLVEPHCLFTLKSLDISGKQDIEIEDLREWISAHPKLKFLGLVLTDVCFDEMFTDKNHIYYKKDLVVTGSCTEMQILHSLRRYKHRPFYVRKSLYYLFRYTQSCTQARTDFIKVIIPAMKIHPKNLGIQISGTACLSHLSKGELGKKTHPHWLSEIIKLVLCAMHNFPHHSQLQRNALLTLCNDRILTEVSFDRYECATLVLNCMCNFDDVVTVRYAVAICSLLAARLSTSESSKIGSNPEYLRRLLSLLHVRVFSDQEVDAIMKYTLSALWNLTDESPLTCQIFVKMNGLALYMKILETYNDESTIQTKVLGLLNNIAEVPILRKSLMTKTIISMISALLNSSVVDVSYFAAGILAHLASDDFLNWNDAELSRKNLLTELSDAVCRWEIPKVEMVAYRSFKPFIPLLRRSELWEVQMWAVWAINHVLSKNRKLILDIFK
ncbi:Protein zyg-11 B [Nymphon striatum]|nr:Protein zyg-11 B [Nymphon striatum]